MQKTSQTKAGGSFRALRIVAAILLNLSIILSGVYVEYHILDHFNPMLSFISGSTLPIVPYLSIIIPILFLLSVLLYDLLWVGGAFKGLQRKKGQVLLVILIDVILFIAFSLVIVTHSCNLLMRLGITHVNEAEIVSVLATPVPTEVPATPTPAVETPAPAQTQTPSDPDATPDPAAEATDTPVPATPEPTVIPGLLGNKYAEKFTDTKTVQVYDRAETKETLPDGTERALIYSYASDKVVVDIYHYQYKNGSKLQEYQFADIYIRDINCFQTHFRIDPGKNVKTPVYAEEIGAIVATNGDNFNGGKLKDGLIIRNGAQLIPNGGKAQTKFSSDLCVLFYDGTMRAYDCKKDRIVYEEILANYPYQAWTFGPKLLNDDGTAKTGFTTLAKANPRTVLGYFEPGHYGLLVIHGDRTMYDYENNYIGTGKDLGLTLQETADLCVKLGFSMAYNLDGGGSSSMVWNRTVFSHNERSHGDILAIVDP